ncbi:MAG: AarF/ABC1/UbiB kinase family protein [Anaerolineae bacterium]|nr:MAG: AarF/ABC1/UbiB kinase family protein [Anaerolineae bacterium]
MKKRGRVDQFRESIRLQKVYNTFMRYGMDILLDRGILGDFRRYMQQWIHNPPVPVVPLSIPVKSRLLLQELGPTYVKMGQIVSSRSEVLPKEWQVELNKLQSDVAPFPYEQVKEIIRDELKGEPEDLYAEFTSEPLAAASTAQVHRAVLFDGTEVVVKVQRPNIINQVKSDLGILNNAASVLSRRLDWARDIDLVGMLDEFGTNLIGELDYRGEAYNARRLERNMESIEGVHIPTIYNNLSTRRVMTMEFIRGIKINNIPAIEEAGYDREWLANVTLRSLVQQLLIDGFFHADLHPGNVLVDLDTKWVTYIDLGMVGEIDINQRLNLIQLLMVMNQKDVTGLGQVMRSLSKPFREVNDRAYNRDFERRVGRYMEPDVHASVSESISVAFDVLRDHGLRLDTELTLALKSLTQVDAIVQVLMPDQSMVDLANKLVREQAVESVTSDKVQSYLTKQVTMTLREAVQRMPTFQEATLKWFDQYQKGRFEINIDTSDLNEELEKARGTASLVVVGVLLAGMIIGSAFAATVATLEGNFWSLLPRVAFLSFLFADVIAIFLVLFLLWRYWRGRSG